MISSPLITMTKTYQITEYTPDSAKFLRNITFLTKSSRHQPQPILSPVTETETFRVEVYLCEIIVTANTYRPTYYVLHTVLSLLM